MFEKDSMYGRALLLNMTQLLLFSLQARSNLELVALLLELINDD